MTTATSTMLDILGSLVSIESPSTDPAATRTCVDEVARLCTSMLGADAEVVLAGGRDHLRWRGGPSPRVGLLGHVDTVFPVGTLARRPFTVTGDVATGPGIFDMKAGVVQALFAVAELDPALRGQVEILLTTDEEIGSPSSRGLIEDFAAGKRAVLVLEPSLDGAMKVARKGVAGYRLTISGRAAHAGLEPEKGVNALLELAHQAIAAAGLADTAKGTTVTPTLASAGSAMNVVPAEASLTVDVRGWEVAELERVHAAMRALRPTVTEARLDIYGEINRPPMERAASADLAARAQRIARDLGLAILGEEAAGGGSDGNFTAALGIPTLDGLGAVGAGAHAESEHILVSALRARTDLVRELIVDVLGSGAHASHG